MMLPFFAFGVALLSGLGVGSAGLLVTWLTMFEQVPQLVAQGLNLVFFLFSSAAALAVHLKKTKPLLFAVLLLLPGGMLGVPLGVHLATRLPTRVLRSLFGIFLLFTGARGLLGKTGKTQKNEKISRSGQ